MSVTGTDADLVLQPRFRVVDHDVPFTDVKEQNERREQARTEQETPHGQRLPSLNPVVLPHQGRELSPPSAHVCNKHNWQCGVIPGREQLVCEGLSISHYLV